MLPSGHSEIYAYPFETEDISYLNIFGQYFYFKYVDAHMRKISFLKLREAYKMKKYVFSQRQFGLLGNWF